MMALTPEERHRAQLWQAEVDLRDDLIQRIKDALGTAETGDVLVEVARNAHRAEMKLAALSREVDEIIDNAMAIDNTGARVSSRALQRLREAIDG